MDDFFVPKTCQGLPWAEIPQGCPGGTNRVTLVTVGTVLAPEWIMAFLCWRWLWTWTQAHSHEQAPHTSRRCLLSSYEARGRECSSLQFTEKLQGWCRAPVCCLLLPPDTSSLDLCQLPQGDPAWRSVYMAYRALSAQLSGPHEGLCPGTFRGPSTTLMAQPDGERVSSGMCGTDVVIPGCARADPLQDRKHSLPSTTSSGPTACGPTRQVAGRAMRSLGS